MASPSIIIPRDQQIADRRGNIRQAWQRQLEILFSQTDRVRKAAEAAPTLDPGTATTSEIASAFNDFISALKGTTS